MNNLYTIACLSRYPPKTYDFTQKHIFNVFYNMINMDKMLYMCIIYVLF